jgi:hypothetical protein
VTVSSWHQLKKGAPRCKGHLAFKQVKLPEIVWHCTGGPTVVFVTCFVTELFKYAYIGSDPQRWRRNQVGLILACIRAVPAYLCILVRRGTFNSGPRGPQFKSGRPDHLSKGVSAQSGFLKSTNSYRPYQSYIFHSALTSFDAASCFSADIAWV